MKPALLFIFIFLASGSVFSQKAFQITTERFGKVRIYEVGIGQQLDYKLKGDLFYRKDIIADMRDTILFMKNEQVVIFRDLKSVRIHKQQHLFGSLQTLFLVGGVGLFAISAFNNATQDISPVINPTVSYVSGAMALTGLIIYELGLRHIRVNKRKTLRVVDRDLNNLNVK